MKKLLLLIGIASIIGCTNADEKLIENKDFRLTIEIGSGWTMWSQKTEINQQGVMVLTEQRENPAPSFERKIFRLTNDEADSLKYKITQVSKTKLSNYGLGENKPTDYASTSIIYTLNSLSDTAIIYYPVEGEVPLKLDNLIGYVYSLRQKYDPHYYLLKKQR
ncbi:MAG: hypothetical protein ACOYOT_06630 [Bacteroidales bacterium]